MASVDSSWISWGVGVFLLKPLKWTLSNMLGDNKVPAEEVLVAVELLKVGARRAESRGHLEWELGSPPSPHAHTARDFDVAAQLITKGGAY